jgi:hypothetical protein
MSVEIGEKSVNVVCAGCITIPFAGIVSQEIFVCEQIGCLDICVSDADEGEEKGK